jgi:hypothetical protein
MQSPVTSNKDRRARFRENTVAEVRFHPIPITGTVYRVVRPIVPSMSPPPQRGVLIVKRLPATPALSFPAASPSLHPVANPTNTAVLFIPPSFLTPGVCLYMLSSCQASSVTYVPHVPGLTHTTRQSSLLRLPSVHCAPSLKLCVGDLFWAFRVFSDAGISPVKPYVTVHDVLLVIYYHPYAAC